MRAAADPGLCARGAAAGFERRVGRQIGIDRLALGAARHLPCGRLAHGFGRRDGLDLDRCGPWREGLKLLRGRRRLWRRVHRRCRRLRLRDQIERRLREGRRRHRRGRGCFGSRTLRRGRSGSRLGRRGAKPARAAAPHLLEIDQQVGKSALDGLQMAEPGIGGVELLRKFGDAVLERAERKLIALAELHAVEPLAQSANRTFQLGRHRASAFHQRRDPRFKLGQRLGAAFGGGALELGAEPAHLGGKLRQRAVGGDVGDDAAQRHHGLLELLERHRIALGRLAGGGDLIDLVRERADGLFETGEALGGVRLRSALRTSASSRSSDPSAAPSAPACRVRSTRSANARTSVSSASMARRGMASVNARPISARSPRSAPSAFS